MEEELKELQTKAAELDKERVEFRRVWAAMLRPDAHPEIDESRAGEDGLSVEDKIRSEKARVKQLESAILNDQVASSCNSQAFKDMEKRAARKRKKSKKERKKRKRAEKAAKKKASRSGGDDGDDDDDYEDDESGSGFSDVASDDFSAEGDYKYCVAAVKKKKKTIKKKIGEWLKPFMGPPGGPPHEDEEAARLFKTHVKGGVSPEDVLPCVEQVVAFVGVESVREGMMESLQRITAAMVPHIEELDEDMSDIMFPDGFHGAPKRPAHRRSKHGI